MVDRQKGQLHLSKCPFLCIVYSSQLAHHLPLSCPQNVSLHSNGGSHVLQLLHAARRHLLPGTSPSRGWCCHLLQHPAGGGWRSSTGVTATAPTPYQGLLPPPPATETAAGLTLPPSPQGMPSLLAGYEARVLWFGLLYSMATQRVSVIWVFIIQVPALQGWLWHRHLEQWDSTNWENPLPVSILTPSPWAPASVPSCAYHHLRRQSRAQFSTESSYLAKNLDFIELGASESPAGKRGPGHQLQQTTESRASNVQGLNPLSPCRWNGRDLSVSAEQALCKRH